jgi:phosphatidate cytidylyltransferase
MTKKRSNLQDRIFASLLLAPSALLVILYGEKSLYLLLFLLGGLMAYEWQDLRLKMAEHRKHVPSVKQWHSAGALYILLPLFCILYLSEHVDRVFLLWLILLVMATDIGAYFVGRKFKGKKLAPHISPGKTWSGLWGGMGSATLITFFFMDQYDVSWMIMLLSGWLISAVSQISDLVESAIKRYANVKDSGKLIPGHGGVLDRVDGYVLAIPFGCLLHAIFSFTPLW